MKIEEVVRSISSLSQKDRDEFSLSLVRCGTIRMWPFVPVRVESWKFPELYGTVFVASDYFALGEGEDVFRVPLSALGAQRVADAMGCLLPTPRIVNTVLRTAGMRLVVSPLGPPYDHTMNDVRRIFRFESNVNAKLSGLDESVLRAGFKKDIVVCKSLSKFHVAIMGFMKPDGTDWQSLNTTSHDANYADYSHGTRLVKREMFIDGATYPIDEVLQDPKLCTLISDEGPGKYARHPGVPSP